MNLVNLYSNGIQRLIFGTHNHQQIVEAVGVPMIWHSDGNIESLLPMAVEAGFVGVHGLDPTAGMDLAKVKNVKPI